MKSSPSKSLHISKQYRAQVFSRSLGPNLSLTRAVNLLAAMVAILSQAAVNHETDTQASCLRLDVGEVISVCSFINLQSKRNIFRKDLSGLTPPVRWYLVPAPSTKGGGG